MIKHKKIIVSALLSLTVLAGSFAAAFAAPALQPKAKYLSVADIRGIVEQITPDEIMGSEVVEADSHLANTIEASFEGIVESSKQQGTGTALVSRNWDRYSSDIPKANMTSNEAKLYDRLDAIASDYLLGTIDAVYIQKYSFYVTSGASYGDLGLTKSEAYKVTEWFVYNNPQYYFLRPKFLIANSAFYMGVYDFAASGTERAALTNSVYDTLDKWIASCNDDEVTTYQKELSAHKLVCNNFSYQTSAYDQSIYSAVFYNKTVCAGYAGVFQIICNASGIDCMTTLSNVHVWNLVKLDDGQWYVVDPTWDDSLNGYYIFNTDAVSARKYDGGNEHVSDAIWTRWSPVVASSEYKPNIYDTTGSHDAPMTLSAPTNIAVDFIDGSSLVSWDSVPNATGYDIEVYNGLSLIGASHVSAKHIYANNVQQYGELQIKVRATAEVEGFTYTSDWADYTVYPEQVLQPYNINVEIQNSTAIITWDGYDHRTYEFELYLDSGYTNLFANKSVNSHSLIINNLKGEYEYFGRVRTVRNNNGTIERSGWVNFDIKRISSQPDISSDPVPQTPSETFSVAVPSNLSAEMISDTICNLSWNTAKNASYYELKITNDEAGDSVVFSTIVHTQSTVLRNIDRLYDYYAYVRSVGMADGQMYYSDWTSVLVCKADVSQTPDVPANTTVAAPTDFMSYVDNGVCYLSWQGASDKTEYQISIDNFNTTLLSSSTFKQNGINLGNVTAGWTYQVRIRFVKNINGQDYYSDWAYSQFGASDSNTSQPNVSQTPNVPANTTVAAPTDFMSYVDNGVCYLSWQGASDKTEYQISIDNFNTTLLSSSTFKQNGINLGNVTAGWTYQVRIRFVKNINGQDYYSDWAYSQFGASDSNTSQPNVSQTPNVPANTTVAAPTDFTSYVDNGVCYLSWQGASDKTEYQISIDNFNTTLLSSSTFKQNGINLGNVTAGWTYQVRIRFVKNINGQDYYSDWAYSQF